MLLIAHEPNQLLLLHASCGAPGLATRAKTMTQPGEGKGCSLLKWMDLGQVKRDQHKLLLWLFSSALSPSHSRRQEQELPLWGGREVGAPEYQLEK